MKEATRTVLSELFDKGFRHVSVTTSGAVKTGSWRMSFHDGESFNAYVGSDAIERLWTIRVQLTDAVDAFVQHAAWIRDWYDRCEVTLRELRVFPGDVREIRAYDGFQLELKMQDMPDFSITSDAMHLPFSWVWTWKGVRIRKQDELFERFDVIDECATIEAAFGFTG